MSGDIITDFIVVNYKENDKDECVHFLTHVEPWWKNINEAVSSTAKLVYTSEFNAWYMETRFGARKSMFVGLKIGKSYRVEYNCHKFIFALFDSNYVTGSVMVLLRGGFGTYLYTGNSCSITGICNSPMLKPILENEGLMQLHLDTTYLEEKSDFKTVPELTAMLISVIKENEGRRINIFTKFGWGLEMVLVEVAKALKERPVIKSGNMKLKVLGFDHLFSKDMKQGNVFIISSLKNRNSGMEEDTREEVILVMERVPSFQTEFKPYTKSGNKHYFRFYCHNTHTECCDLISSLNPELILPIGVKESSTRIINESCNKAEGTENTQGTEKSIELRSIEKPDEEGGKSLALQVKPLALSPVGGKKTRRNLGWVKCSRKPLGPTPRDTLQLMLEQIQLKKALNLENECGYFNFISNGGEGLIARFVRYDGSKSLTIPMGKNSVVPSLLRRSNEMKRQRNAFRKNSRSASSSSLEGKTDVNCNVVMQFERERGLEMIGLDSSLPVGPPSLLKLKHQSAFEPILQRSITHNLDEEMGGPSSSSQTCATLDNLEGAHKSSVLIHTFQSGRKRQIPWPHEQISSKKPKSRSSKMERTDYKRPETQTLAWMKGSYFSNVDDENSVWKESKKKVLQIDCTLENYSDGFSGFPTVSSQGSSGSYKNSTDQGLVTSKNQFSVPAKQARNLDLLECRIILDRLMESSGYKYSETDLCFRRK